MIVKQITKEEWKPLAKPVHEAVFGELWDPEFERLDYALIADVNGIAIQYAVIRESDRDTAYVQYGGSFPDHRNSIVSYRAYQAILNWLYERYKAVSFLTENINLPMIKFAIKEGFIIVGMRNFNGHVMLEFIKRKGG